MTENAGADKSGKRWSGRKMIAFVFGRHNQEPGTWSGRIIRLILEVSSIVLTLCLVWLGALGFLMNREKVDLAFFKPHYEQWFSGAFDGRKTDIKTYEARWLENRHRIEIRTGDIEIEGRTGVRESISELTAELAFSPKIWRRPDIKRLNVNGGAVTIFKDDAGVLKVGFGTPETFENVAPFWEYKGRLDTAQTFTVHGLWQQIEIVDIKAAKLYIVDEAQGVNLALVVDEGVYRFDGKYLNISGTGRLLQGEHQVPFFYRLKTTPDRSEFTAHIDVEDLNPSGIVAKTGMFASLAALDTLLDVRVNIVSTPRQGISRLDVELAAGQGKINLAGKTFDFNRVGFVAAYDTGTSSLNLGRIDIDSERLVLTGTTSLSDIGTPRRGFFRDNFNFETEIEKAKLVLGSRFDKPFEIEKGVLRGTLNLGNQILDFGKLYLDFGNFAFDFTGGAHQNPNGKLAGISLHGRIHGAMTSQQFLAFWPNNFALGARNWMDRSVKAGFLKNFVIDFDIDENDLGSGRVANDHLKMTFDAENTDIQYMRTMPWLRKANGYGTLRGNRLDFQLTSGQVDGLTVDKGFVTIPRFSPKGGDFTIDVEGRGTAAEMLRVSNFPPFEFTKKFGANPEDFGGTGQIKMRITRPLLEFFDRDRIRYELSGDFTNVSVPVGIGSAVLNSGSLQMEADATGINVSGPIKIGSWPAVLDWQKPLGVTPSPAKYTITGRIARDHLDAFGIGLRRYFGGELGITITGTGDGLSVQKADIAVDFKNADLNAGTLWYKAQGERGEMSGTLVFNDTGLGLEDLKIFSDDLDIAGNIVLAKDFRLIDVDISRAKIGGIINAAIQAKLHPTGVLSVFVTGDYFNAAPWVRSFFKTSSTITEIPVQMTFSLKTLSVSEGYDLTNASALFAYDGAAMQHSWLKGETEDGEVLAEVTLDQEDRMRHVRVEIPNAGKAILSLLGIASIRDGVLSIDGTLSPAGKNGGITGTLQLYEFTLVGAPVFAHILSVASLTGLSDTLAGEGLGFESFETRFGLEESVVKIRDARGSGPALALTGNGDIVLDDKSLDMDGVVLPSYIMNSVLGEVPVISDLLIGKKGEGIFALNYNVKGSFKAMQITVNPLSALTPGFLRRIFDVDREDIGNIKVEKDETKKPEY